MDEKIINREALKKKLQALKKRAIMDKHDKFSYLHGDFINSEMI